LLDAYEGQVTLDQLNALELAIKERISGLISMEDFRKRLHASIPEGGVDLHLPTAHAFSEHLEKLLAQGTHLG